MEVVYLNIKFIIFSLLKYTFRNYPVPMGFLKIGLKCFKLCSTTPVFVEREILELFSKLQIDQF